MYRKKIEHGNAVIQLEVQLNVQGQENADEQVHVFSAKFDGIEISEMNKTTVPGEEFESALHEFEENARQAVDNYSDQPLSREEEILLSLGYTK